MRLGAQPVGDGSTRFEVWAPRAGSVTVELVDGRRAGLGRDESSETWVGIVDGVGHGDRYRIRVDDGEPLADPASGWQPDGVHGPSAVVDPATFAWTDGGWRGVALADTVLYELHVGTFSPAGTFDGVARQLDRLARLGVTTIELMPVAAFPGVRNWGYDGVFPSAVQHSYGGPDGLARLVDAAHGAGVAVVLDVVYNHLGPEGSTHGRLAPYFTDEYRTPWGDAINVAGPGSDLVRRSFIESACRWVEDFHVDGFRLDAVHAIVDPTAMPFLEQLAGAVHAAGEAAGRTVLVIAESSANDPRLVRPPSAGGIGCDAVWDDDVHHALRVALTGDRRGYYADYDGVADLADAMAQRWVFRGRPSISRGRSHGRPADDVPPERFVVFTANHDHVGNTPDGARPPYDHRRRLVAAATVLLSPFTPLLFMGEEYAETAPFPFFVDHGDPARIEATREGRRREFSDAGWTVAMLDPGEPATFAAAVLDPSLAEQPPHAGVLAAYTELLSLRRRHPVVHAADAEQTVDRQGDTVVLTRTDHGTRSVLAVNLGSSPAEIEVGPGVAVVFDSADPRWAGDGEGAELAGGRLHLPGFTAALLLSP